MPLPAAAEPLEGRPRVAAVTALLPYLTSHRTRALSRLERAQNNALCAEPEADDHSEAASAAPLDEGGVLPGVKELLRIIDTAIIR